MSNTIRRPRKRPRRRSSSLRVLFWLIRREAAFTVLAPLMYGADAPHSRARFLRKDWRWITRRFQRPYSFYPGGKYLP